MTEQPTSHPQDDQQVPAAAAEPQPPREERPEVPVTEESVSDASTQTDASAQSDAAAPSEGADAPAEAAADDTPPAEATPGTDAADGAPVADAPAEATPGTDAAAAAPADNGSAAEVATSAAPAEDAPTSDAPVEDASVSDAPVADAPTTEALATADAPADDAPAAEVVTSEAPATAEAPADDAPVAEVATSESSATTETSTDAADAEAPAEDAAVGDAPAEDAPADEASTTEAPSEAAPDSDAAVAVPTDVTPASGAPAETPADAVPADVAPAEDRPVPAGDAAPAEDVVEVVAPEPESSAADETPAADETSAADETPAADSTPAAPGPRPAPVPRPAPRPPLPGHRAAAAPAAPVPPVDAHDAAEAAAWGRVDPDGTVWVREATGERTVGQYPGADTQEALAFYVRRFLDLQAQVALFEARLPQLAVKEIDQTMSTLREGLEAPTAVGDIDGLRARLETLRGRATERRKELAAEREALKAQALTERTAIVERAEAIAGTDPAKIQWRSTGEELRGLLDQWKAAQRSGPRLDRPSEDALWKRFSQARTTFDRHRRQYFAELDATQGEAKAAKEKLVQRAESLSTSTDWGATSAAYRGLMDEWKQAGRANRKDDDALWARFRAAQQVFFDARNAQNAQVDAEYSKNLEVKLALLEQAEALLPVTDPAAAKGALRPIQERWEEAGKVPRADVQRVEGRMRAVEQAVRDADQQRWQRTDPEKKARAEGAAAQLQDSIAALEADVAKAQSRGDERAVTRAREALEARQAWLDQVLRAAEDPR